MDKPQQNNHPGLHHEESAEDSAQPHMSHLLEQKPLNHEADLDALEARLFAMARSRR